MSGAEANHGDDELLSSPYSRISLCPKTEQIINCAMGLRHPLDVDALKKAFLESAIIGHPRFCSLVVRDRVKEYWRKTHVNIDDHFIVVHNPTTTVIKSEDDVEVAVNAYLANLALSTKLSENKPLWEVHVLLGLNCVVLRVHHALGDGASLMSMLSACFGKQREGVAEIESGAMKEMAKGEQKGRKWRKGGVWGWVKTAWFTMVFATKNLGMVFCVKDGRTVIHGGKGIELWPRKLETVKFQLQEFKSIKKVIPNTTINDVLLGVVSSGLSRYLQVKSPDDLQHGLQVTTVLPVNLRKETSLQKLTDMMRANTWWCGSSSWGNKTGMVLQPMHCCNGLHPLDHVKRMKAIMDQKKQSYEAHMSYLFAKLTLPCLGPKVVSSCLYKLACNTTLAISNIVGPSEELVIASNPVTYIRVNISSVPHALVMYMVSYAGKADLQVMVAKDIISDSRFLVECFKESLREMKNFIGGGNN